MEPSRSAPHPYWALIYHVVDEYVEKRARFRAEHLGMARASVERGELLLGGAFSDPVDGALLVFHAPREVVEEFVRHDPYVRAGLVTRWEIRGWTVVVGSALAAPSMGA